MKELQDAATQGDGAQARQQAEALEAKVKQLHAACTRKDETIRDLKDKVDKLTRWV